MPPHVCGNPNGAASPHRLRRVLCPVRLSVHPWHVRERDVPTSPTSRRTPPASSWSSSQSCRSALTPTWSRPTGGARRIDHQGQSWRAPSPAGAFGALTGPAHGAHVDSPRAMWGGSAPVDELLSAPTWTHLAVGGSGARHRERACHVVVCALRHVAALRARHQTRRCRRRPRPSPLPRTSPPVEM